MGGKGGFRIGDDEDEAEEGVGFVRFGAFWFCFEIGVVVLVVVVVSGWEGRERVWVVGGVEEEAVGAAVRLRLPGFAVGVPSLVVGMVSMCDLLDR